MSAVFSFRWLVLVVCWQVTSSKRMIIQEHRVGTSQTCQRPSPITDAKDMPKSPFLAGSICSTGLFADAEDGEIRSYNIIIDKENLEFLDNKPTAEEWAKCDFELNHGMSLDSGTPPTIVKGVRCRYKGSVGSFSGCVDEQGKKLPSTGNSVCRKLSWKISLKNGENKDAAMGLKTFQLLGMQHDDSLLKNRLSYAILNDAGFVAPCAAPANVYVNGVYDGVYDMVENVDDALTKKRFSMDTRWHNDEHGGDGTLYKETWPVSEDPEFYKDMEPIPGLSSPGIKEDGGGEHGEVFANLQKQATECLKETIEKCDAHKASNILSEFTDEQSFIDGLVGMTMVANWDQIINLFHNFYIYVRTEKANETSKGVSKLVYIPWDFNEALVSTHGAPFSGVANPSGISLPWPWYHELTADERKAACPWTPDIAALKHFTCDPVGQLMAKAWKDRFFKTFRRVSDNNVTAKAQAHVDRWARQTKSAIACDATNGNWPALPTQERAASPLIPELREILKLWNGLGDGSAEWPVECDIFGKCWERSNGVHGFCGGLRWAMGVAFAAFLSGTSSLF